MDCAWGWTFILFSRSFLRLVQFGSFPFIASPGCTPLDINSSAHPTAAGLFAHFRLATCVAFRRTPPAPSRVRTFSPRHHELFLDSFVDIWNSSTPALRFVCRRVFSTACARLVPRASLLFLFFLWDCPLCFCTPPSRTAGLSASCCMVWFRANSRAHAGYGCLADGFAWTVSWFRTPGFLDTSCGAFRFHLSRTFSFALMSLHRWFSLLT